MTKSGLSVKIPKETSLLELNHKIKLCKEALDRHIRRKGFREPGEQEVKVTMELRDKEMVFKFLYVFDEEDKSLLISKGERGI